MSVSANGRVDFRLAKSVITLQILLDHYNLSAGLKKSKDERVGECPICKAAGKRAFKANVVKNVFRCFSCDANGDIIAFVKAMERCTTLADAGGKLREMFPTEIAAAEALNGQSSIAQPPAVSAAPQPPQRPGGLLCYLVFPADDAQPTNERACDLLSALPWVSRVSICVQNGSEVIEAVGFTR